MSPRCSSRRSLREGWNRFRGRAGSSIPLPLALSVTRSLSSSNRAVDPSQLEVTTGHRLNQSKPCFISLSPALSVCFFSLFLFILFRSCISRAVSSSSRFPLSSSASSFHLDSLSFLSLPGLDHLPAAAVSRDSRARTERRSYAAANQEKLGS